MAVIRDIFDDMNRVGNDISTHLSLEYSKNERGLPKLHSTHDDRHFGSSGPYGRTQGRGIQCPECYTHIDANGDRTTTVEYSRSRYPDGRIVEFGRNVLPRERTVEFDTEYYDQDDTVPEYSRSHFPEETRFHDLGRNRYYDDRSSGYDRLASTNDYDRVVQFGRDVASDNRRGHFSRSYDTQKRYRYPERSIATPLAIDRRDDGRYDRRGRIVMSPTVNRLTLDGVRSYDRPTSTYSGIRNERPLRSSLKQSSRPPSRHVTINQFPVDDQSLEPRYDPKGVGFRASYNITKYAICGRPENITLTVSTVVNGRALKGNRNEFEINAVVQRPDGSTKPLSVKRHLNGKCSMEFREVFHGTYYLDICVNGVSIPQSPFNIEVMDGWHMGKKMSVGTTVVRGPDWKHGNEDGGYSGKGTVTRAVEEFRRGWTVTVQWDYDGNLRQYNMDHYSCPLRLCDFYSNISSTYNR
ncbi:uncharacterized protein LOC144448274 [Glandiceps talaboti]